VAIRLGAAGSLVGTAGGERWHVPAVPTRVVDVTGAGNAYCGGFLVGLAEGLPPPEAALRAAVSASFALEQFGLPHFDAGTAGEAAARLTWARQHIARV
jgi:sugar/nucleoside kinase (ribokinase family)